MKRTFYIITALVVFASTLQAQLMDSSKVPQVVRGKLKRMYPDARNITWANESYTQTSVIDGKTVEKELCFRAFFPHKDKYEELYFDSTALWYRDEEVDYKPLTPIVVPDGAREKVKSLFAKREDISWGYCGWQPERLKDCEYEAYINDSTVERYYYFDSDWKYKGSVVEIFWDTISIPVPAIETYIKQNFKYHEVSTLETVRGTDDAIIAIVVVLEIKEKRYNHCRLYFDEKGKLLMKPQKTWFVPGDF
jgi:hypothetical protein